MSSEAKASDTADAPLYQCTGCNQKFGSYSDVYTHVKVGHGVSAFNVNKSVKMLAVSNWKPVKSSAFSEVVDKELKKYMAKQKEEIFWGGSPATVTIDTMMNVVQTEEKPMKTFSYADAAKAKKQRDVIRNKVRGDIGRYVTAFGVSEFEAAHVILDSVLNGINDKAKSYGTAKLECNLAQTFLPDTLCFTEGGGTIAVAGDFSPVGSKAGTASPMAQLNAQKAAKKSKLVSSAPKSSHGLAKLDKDVTKDDLEGTFMVEFTKQYKVIDMLSKNYKTTNGDINFFLRGSTYVYGSQAEKFNGLTGSMKVLFQVSKAAPYISASDVSNYQLVAPSGYKFRKLKNKPIYKVQKDAKQKYYWTKRDAVKAAKVVAVADTFIPTPGPSITEDSSVKTNSVMVKSNDPNVGASYISTNKPYGGAIIKMYPAPEGYAWIKDLAKDSGTLVSLKPYALVPYNLALVCYGSGYLASDMHFETYVSDPTHAIVIPNTYASNVGAAKFPKPITVADYGHSYASYEDEANSYLDGDSV